MTNYLRISIVAVLFLVGTWSANSFAARTIIEPVLADYSKIPVFSSLDTPPNIMVIFDSSGSMAWNAYGAPKTDNAYRDDVYVPLYGKETTLFYDIASGADDAEEYISSGLTYNNGLDLDLGRSGRDRAGRILHNQVGMRFENIALEKGTVIVRAYLEMEAARTPASALNEKLVLAISAETSPGALSFSNTYSNISGRVYSTTKKFWTHDNTADADLDGVPDNPWLEGSKYQIPGLETIVQEVLKHPSWKADAAKDNISLKLVYGTFSATAQRNIVSYDAWSHDPSASLPRLYITYKSFSGTPYYGYFNSEWFYTSNTNEFTHKYKKISYIDKSKYDMSKPVEKADYDNLLAQASGKTNCGVTPDKVWFVRYPASYSNPNLVEDTWSTKCLADADLGTEALYDGNWMNWATTRRVDVARKVMTGGLGAMYGQGNKTLYGDNPPDAYYDPDWKVRYNSKDGANHAVTPFISTTADSGDDIHYELIRPNGGTAGQFKDSTRTHKLGVLQSPYFDPDSFTDDGKLGGILQTFWEDAYWGLTTYHTEDTSGGNIQYGTKHHNTNANYMSAINNLQVESWTPLAETLYSVTQYFKNKDPASNLGYLNQPENHDPFSRNNNSVACVKNFVLLISDGNSTADSRIPDEFKGLGTDQDGDLDEDCSNNDYGCVDDYDGLPVTYSNGSDYLDDIALYAHTTDLRPPVSTTSNKGVVTVTDDLEGDQVLDIYTVFAAFGADTNSGDYKAARNLLIDTAINGGFEDQDGDGKPTFTDDNGDAVVDPSDGDGDWDPGEPTSAEFDKDDDGLPDNYFEASDGADLKTKLAAAIASILAKSASGTAVSVLATSSEGEGTLVQAYFKPKTTGDPDGTLEMKWAGYLQALWVDSYGNMREDTGTETWVDENGDPQTTLGTPLALDEGQDKIITFQVENGDTKVNKFTVSPDSQSTMYPSTDLAVNSDYIREGIDTITPIWEAGRVLAKTDPGKRKIFTYIDPPPVGVTATPLFGGVKFHQDNKKALQPYLGVFDYNTWSYLGLDIDDRSLNLINYIRGHPGSSLAGTATTRNRRILVDGIDRVWKLGDIVNSTPVTIQQPPDNYDVIYADKDYAAYKKEKMVHWDSGVLKGWETMVYVGANDGMLHAFTGWKYDKKAKTYRQPGDTFIDFYGDLRTASGTYDMNEQIGQEVWAYIPRALLPHLKWYPDIDYEHTYYVDLRPRVVDLDIFDDPCTHGGKHIKGWGTVLIGGLRMGGKEIVVEEDFDNNGSEEVEIFTPSYFAIDITDPRNPNLLWEESYGDLGLTTSEPTVMKVQDEWFIVFGSGPNDPCANLNDNACDRTDQGAYEGVTSQPGRVYIVDAKTGVPVKDTVADPDTDYLFSTAEDNTFMAGGASIDKFMNFNVDGLYIGAAHDNGNNPDWTGSMYKITVPWVCGGSCTGYGDLDNGAFVDHPTTGAKPWTFTKIFDSPGPVTAPPSLSIDTKQNTWIYFGTGRYMSTTDKSDDDPQYLFGIKDPFFNYLAETTTNPPCCGLDPACTDPTCGYNSYAADYYLDYTNNLTLNKDRLFDGDTYKVFFPWTANPSVAGTAATCDKSIEDTINPLYKIGDIYGNDSCVAYNYVCNDTVPNGCATLPAQPIGDLGPAGDGNIDFNGDSVGDDLCECRRDDAVPTTWGIWGVKATSGDQADCTGINSGELGDVYNGVAGKDGTCIGMYWDVHPDTSDPLATASSCEGVSFGEVGTGLGDGHCVATSNVGSGTTYAVDTTKVPKIYYHSRPAGDCTDADPNYVGSIYNDADNDGFEDNPPYDGYCLSTFWTCKEDGEDPIGDCALKREDGTAGANINFHADSNVNAPGLSTDVDTALAGGDDEDDCICSFSQEPVPHVKFDNSTDPPTPVTGGAFDTTTGKVLEFFDILKEARKRDGWFRRLATPRERSITKPGLIGGISLFTSYVPNEDECAFGGDSFLYALYYETGTAYREKVIGWEIDDAGDLTPSDRMRLGTGLASSVGLHIGLQDEDNSATGFVQQSTGAITKLRIDPAFQIRSGLTSWRDN